METQVFDTKPLLRPHQVAEAKDEIKAAEAKLNSPHIEDKGEVAKQLRRLNKSFADQVPQAPVNGSEEGNMVARSKALLADILVGMPSQEEMRKAPPGAVDKHMKWEKRNKLKILEWKNLQLRLTHGEESEAAVLERHRPVASSLLMDNTYIQGKQFHFGPAGAGLPTTFSEDQIALIRALNPQLGEILGTLDNQQRAEVKDTVLGIGLEPSAASLAGKRGTDKQWKKHRLDAAKKKKRTLSPEHMAKLQAGRARRQIEMAGASPDKAV